MPLHVQPEKGRWYHDIEADRNLQVTWMDEDQTLIEARFEDGHSEQFPLAAWNDLLLEPQDTGGGLSNEEYRRASDWGERSPDDFPDG